jgi:hypothetical protein
VAHYAGGPLDYVELPVPFDPAEREAYLARELVPALDRLAREWDRAWLIAVQANTDPHGFPHARNAALSRPDAGDPLKATLDARYPLLDQRPFPGLWLARYALR